MTLRGGDRPGRRVPIASPEAEASLSPMAEAQVGAASRKFGRVPATGGPDFLRGAGNTAHRIQRMRTMRRAMLVLLLIGWGITVTLGRGETVILVMPYDIRGQAGDTPVSAAVATVESINKQVRMLKTPGFELRIGAQSLDRSTASVEQVRWLVTAPEVRLRAAQGWWYVGSTSPSDGVVIPQLMLQRGLWMLTGRRVLIYRGQILAASGRLTLHSRIDTHSLNSEQVRGRDWKNGLYMVNEALLADYMPIGATVAYLRIHEFERARSIAELLLLDTDKGNDLFASAVQIYADQASVGGVAVPARAYEKLWTAGSLPAPRWHDALVDWWPSRARRRRMEAGVMQLAAAQTMESGSFSMGCELADQARVRSGGNRTSKLMLAYGYFRQRGSHDMMNARDLCVDLAERWPDNEPNHAANLLYEVMREIRDWPELMQKAEQLAFPQEPGDPVLLNNRAVWAWYRKQYASTRTNLDAALEARPRRVVAMENRASVAGFDGDLLVAGKTFETARTRTGHLASTWLHPARFLFDRGDYGLAADLLDEGSQRLPEHYELTLQSAYVRAAELSVWKHRLPESGLTDPNLWDVPQQMLEAANGPLVPVDRYELYRGHVAYLTGNLQTAEEAYRASEDAGEASGLAEYGLAHAYLLQGDWLQAQLHFSWFLGREPSHTRARLFYYIAMLQQGDPLAETMLRESAKAEERPWIRYIMELYLGERSPEAVRNSAYLEDGISDTERRRREVVVELHIGVWRLQRDPEDPEGWESLKKVVQTGLAHHYEFQAAVALLRRQIGMADPARSAVAPPE